jgi:glycosyltransferase involved in cell wall biosynthesis
MDIVVLSTHYEGLPLVLLEAMACGKPVVATEVDGVPELVTDNQTGLLFAHQDHARLAGHVISLIRDPVRAAALGMSGRSFVQSKFNNHQFRRGIVDLYDSVLGGDRLSAAARRSLVPFADLALRAGYAAVDASVRAHGLSRSTRA